MKKRKEEER